jgi:hypothetical protein
LLAAKKPAPETEPVASDAAKPVTSTKSDKAAAQAPDDLANVSDASGLRRGLATDETPAGGPGGGQIRTADAGATAGTLTDAAPGKAASDPAPAAAPDQPKPNGSGADAAERTDTVAGKDEARPGDQPGLVLPALKPKAQLAAFVSGKDGKLYVRQDQAPLFDVPVKIAPSDRLLGTHVFTAEVDKDNAVRWTVVSLPASRSLEPARANQKSQRNANGLAEQPKPPPELGSATEALDRLTIPPEALARLADGLSSGASLIVSDQGIAAGETGQGTDFIVRLR